MTDLYSSAAGVRPTMNPSFSPVITGTKKKKRLLIVHHDANFGLLLRLAFKSEPYIIYETTDKEVTLTMCSEPNLDLVLLDMVMPHLDGASILQHIRRVNQTVSIIMISALNPNMWIDVALKSGADGFMTKPFSLTSIRQAVSKQLEGGRLKVKAEVVS